MYIERCLKTCRVMCSLCFNFMAIAIVHSLKQCQKNRKQQSVKRGRWGEMGEGEMKSRIEYSQLSSCMVQVWMSIGKFFKSMGQDRMSVSLRQSAKQESRKWGIVSGKRETTKGRKRPNIVCKEHWGGEVEAKKIVEDFLSFFTLVSWPSCLFF